MSTIKKAKAFAERTKNIVVDDSFDEMEEATVFKEILEEVEQNAHNFNTEETIETLIILSNIKDPSTEDEYYIDIIDDFWITANKVCNPISLIQYQIDKGIIEEKTELTINYKKSSAVNMINFFDRVENIKNSMIDNFFKNGEIKDNTEADENLQMAFEFMKFLIEQKNN